MNSSVSALTRSTFVSGSSRSFSGGSGESGRFVEERHLLFALDALRLLDLDRRRLDADRLVDLELLLALLHDLVALDHATARPPAGPAALPLWRTRSRTRARGQPPTRSRCQPGHAGKKAEPAAASASSKRCAPVKPKRRDDSHAQTAPSMPPGRERQRGLDRLWRRSASMPRCASRSTTNPQADRVRSRSPRHVLDAPVTPEHERRRRGRPHH